MAHVAGLNAMNPPPLPAPPIVRDQDAEQLRLLSIFHYVVAGFGVFGMCFMGFHYYMMSTIFMNPRMWEESQKGGPPPEVFFDAFKWVYVAAGLVFLVDIVMNVLAAGALARRRNRTLCFITSGLNCLQFPLGTLLGVFTIIVLNRDSVRAKFAAAEQAPASA
jgi:hypothetical protein